MMPISLMPIFAACCRRCFAADAASDAVAIHYAVIFAFRIILMLMILILIFMIRHAIFRCCFLFSAFDFRRRCYFADYSFAEMPYADDMLRCCHY